MKKTVKITARNAEEFISGSHRTCYHDGNFHCIFKNPHLSSAIASDRRVLIRLEPHYTLCCSIPIVSEASDQYTERTILYSQDYVTTRLHAFIRYRNTKRVLRKMYFLSVKHVKKHTVTKMAESEILLEKNEMKNLLRALLMGSHPNYLATNNILCINM
jgi:hypothetical protein